MDAFYQTVAAFCFTLLGLWWAVVQFRHAEWMNDLRQRRAAYSVHLSFLVPGIMSLGAMIAGDVKILWRLVFIVACGFGILAMIFLSVGAPADGAKPRGGFFIRQGRWLTILALCADRNRGCSANPGRNLGRQPQTAPGGGSAADPVGVRGRERRLGLSGGAVRDRLRRVDGMALSFGQHRRLLTTYLAPQRARVALLAVLLLAGIGLQLLNPQVMRFFIDTAEAGGPTRALLLAALVYLVAGLLGRGLTFATSYVSLNVAWKATNALRGDLTRHCLRLDMPFHKTHTPGEMIERVDGDALALGTFFSQMVVKTAGNALLVIAILYLLYRENAAAGLILTAYTALIVAVLAGTQNLGAKRWAAARQAWAEQSGFLEEHIAGSEDIRGVGAEQYVLDKLLGIMHSLTERARGGWMANALGFSITNFLYIVGYGLGLAIGAYLYTRGSVTIGTAFVMVYYIGMLAAPLDEIRDQAKELQQATGSVGRINELFALQPQVVETARRRTARRCAECRVRGCVVCL